MIEVYKILHNIYDKEVTTGILNPWNSLSEEVVTTQHQSVQIKTGQDCGRTS